MQLHKIYRPVTSMPFSQDDTYMEYEPCGALKPYIRCFWGSRRPYLRKKSGITIERLVIPDTCMDIIFDINFTRNRIIGRFCGMDDKSFFSGGAEQENELFSTFAVRFYPWGAALFAEDSMRQVKGQVFEVGQYFQRMKREIEYRLFDVVTIEERIAITEAFLLKHICHARENRMVLEAMGNILQGRGSKKIGKLSKDLHMSGRQLERHFKEMIGVSPKQLSSLIRYQCLWSDILFLRDFDIMDEVYRLGYSDQAHIYHDFKRYHTMSVKEAQILAGKRLD